MFRQIHVEGIFVDSGSCGVNFHSIEIRRTQLGVGCGWKNREELNFKRQLRRIQNNKSLGGICGTNVALEHSSLRKDWISDWISNATVCCM